VTRRAGRAAGLVVVGLLLDVPPALACPACFGQGEGPMIDAARLGIWLLLGVTLLLQGGFAAFFLYLRRRATRASRREQEIGEEWSRLQRDWTGTGRSEAR
jgi:hypothetical protein